MNSIQGKHGSFWLDTCARETFPSLQQDLKVDVVIVGGGITGLNTAWMLQQNGVNVAVIEAGRIASGVTGHSTAKITSQHGHIYEHLVTTMGKDAARMYASANQAAIGQYRDIVESLGIECGLGTRSAFLYTRDKDQKPALEKETKAAQECGIPARFVQETDLPFAIQGTVEFPDQAQFHPCRYLAGLAKQLKEEGVRIFENTRALSIKDGTSPRVKTDGGSIRAEKVVLANHSPAQYSVLFYTRMYPKRSYVVAAKISGSLPNGMYYGLGEPFHSIRNYEESGSQLLLLGGQNHKTGHHHSSVERYEQLESDVRSMFEVLSVENRWSTQDQVSMDRIPYIGKVPVSKNVFVALGYGGWGISHAMVAATLLKDLILGRVNDWKLLYAPSRIKLTGISVAVEENIHFARHVVEDHVHSPAAVRPGQLQPGQGTIGILHGKKAAVAKDTSGTIHARSPYCTHMGCAVVFNDGEQSWDCPCHGSRFGTDGSVLHGPADTPLKKSRGEEEPSRPDEP